MNEQKDTFLWQALEEIDGFDGVLLPQDFYDFIVRRDGTCPYSVDELEAWLNEAEREPPDLVAEQLHRIESPGYNELGEDEPLYHFPDEDEDDVEGDGSHLHQCPYCYNLVNEEHEEFCRLNPNRNREVV